MKLRLRPLKSKETIKIEAPNLCTLSRLKEILAQALSNSPTPASIRLSLNRKDELRSDGDESLYTLGIAAGDLIFFSVEYGIASNSQNIVPQGTESSLEPDLKTSKCSSSFMTKYVPRGSPNVETTGIGSQIEETVDAMEMESEDNENKIDVGGFSVGVVHKSFSVPGFLRKVFTEELDDSGRDHKLVVIAIHAVMLESGFVGFDRNKNEVVSGSLFRNKWKGLLGLSLLYTLPESLNCKTDINCVVLKFQSLGNFINVYGTLGNGSRRRGTYGVQLDEDHLVRFLNVVWANCGVTETLHCMSEATTSPEKEVFKFWRTVKDRIALPLLIDLCEEAGFQLPPCFMQLPTDLKLKILEYLSGSEIAKVNCVSSEMRYLGSNDDLWKLKFSEEFGNERNEPHVSWKKAFSTQWHRRKNRKHTCRLRASPFWPAPYWPQPRRRYPNPYVVPRVPRVVGGDYDIAPAFGNDLHGSENHNFSPSCNVGVRGGRFV